MKRIVTRFGLFAAGMGVAALAVLIAPGGIIPSAALADGCAATTVDGLLVCADHVLDEHLGADAFVENRQGRSDFLPLVNKLDEALAKYLGGKLGDAWEKLADASAKLEKAKYVDAAAAAEGAYLQEILAQAQNAICVEDPSLAQCQ